MTPGHQPFGLLMSPLCKDLLLPQNDMSRLVYQVSGSNFMPQSNFLESGAYTAQKLFRIAVKKVVVIFSCKNPFNALC